MVTVKKKPGCGLSAAGLIDNLALPTGPSAKTSGLPSASATTAAAVPVPSAVPSAPVASAQPTALSPPAATASSSMKESKKVHQRERLLTGLTPTPSRVDTLHQSRPESAGVKTRPESGGSSSGSSTSSTGSSSSTSSSSGSGSGGSSATKIRAESSGNNSTGAAVAKSDSGHNRTDPVPMNCRPEGGNTGKSRAEATILAYGRITEWSSPINLDHSSKVLDSLKPVGHHGACSKGESSIAASSTTISITTATTSTFSSSSNTTSSASPSIPISTSASTAASTFTNSSTSSTSNRQRQSEGNHSNPNSNSSLNLSSSGSNKNNGGSNNNSNSSSNRSAETVKSDASSAGKAPTGIHVRPDLCAVRPDRMEALSKRSDTPSKVGDSTKMRSSDPLADSLGKSGARLDSSSHFSRVDSMQMVPTSSASSVAKTTESPVSKSTDSSVIKLNETAASSKAHKANKSSLTLVDSGFQWKDDVVAIGLDVEMEEPKSSSNKTSDMSVLKAPKKPPQQDEPEDQESLLQRDLAMVLEELTRQVHAHFVFLWYIYTSSGPLLRALFTCVWSVFKVVYHELEINILIETLI